MITWNIVQLNCYPDKDGLTDVVFTVHWDCTGVDGDYSGRVYGSCGVTLDPSAPYTPYAELTKDQVLSWIWASGVDKEETENAVNAQIESQKNPTVVSPPLPWSSSQAE
jgi:hypothetical protein